MKPKVLILGGGFGGAYAAKAFSKFRDQVDVTLIDRRNFAVFYPLLIEAGVGAIEPRHVVVPLRRFAKGCEFKLAEVQSVDVAAKTVEIQLIGEEESQTLSYDHLILSFGSVTRFVDMPGLRENAFQLKSLSDAIAMRDRAIQLLELADASNDESVRQAYLTVVTIGSNFTGIEFAGEFHAFMVDASRDYPNVDPKKIRMLVLERGDRILNSVADDLAAWAKQAMERRGIEFFYHTTATSIAEDHVVLGNGMVVPCHTVMWAAGVAPNPILDRIPGLPRNKAGYVDCERDLSVKGVDGVWAIGDTATVLTADGKPYPPTAQNATRQGPLTAKNIIAKINGTPTKTFDFKPLGAFASIGGRSATAEMMGLKFKGFLGWFFYRGVYLSKMPTLAMKLRLSIDWAVELALKSEPVALGLHRPRHGGEPE